MLAGPAKPYVKLIFVNPMIWHDALEELAVAKEKSPQQIIAVKTLSSLVVLAFKVLTFYFILNVMGRGEK